MAKQNKDIGESSQQYLKKWQKWSGGDKHQWEEHSYENVKVMKKQEVNLDDILIDVKPEKGKK